VHRASIARDGESEVKTGGIEVIAGEIRLLNDAKTPPFPVVDDSPVAEDTRLNALCGPRRARMQHNRRCATGSIEVRKFRRAGFRDRNANAHQIHA
jgi:aspartyl-tRNA synthetase